jgi:hypothetical protein
MRIASRTLCLQTLGTLLALALPLLLCSCARDNHKPVFPVQGKVLYKGQPAQNAIVFLHPLGKVAPDEPTPRGIVAADGSFRIGTYRDKDGAPAGQYAVTVVWKTEAKGGDDQDNLLPARYLNPSTSGLTAQVKEGPNELEPFQLK